MNERHARLRPYPFERLAEIVQATESARGKSRIDLSIGEPKHDALAHDTHVLPLNGTREGLFAIAQCLIDHKRARPTVVLPNPFYQIYEGAALLAGAESAYVDCPAANEEMP